MSISADSYQPFQPSSAVTVCPQVSPPCRQFVTTQNGFQKWGKGADFRQFQRDRAKSVTIVTTFWASLPCKDGLDRLFGLETPEFWALSKWETLLFDCYRFARDWGALAFQHGWSERELFGCNPDPTAGRLDNNGLLITLKGRSILALNERDAIIDAGKGVRQTFRRGFPLTTSVPIWRAFGPKTGP